MDPVAAEITVHTCRFCLSQDEDTRSVFERFDSKALSENLQCLLGIQLEPSDKYTSICEKCESKVKLMFSVMAEFRKVNILFCSLLEQERNLRQNLPKSKVRISIEILDQKALVPILGNSSQGAQPYLKEEPNVTLGTAFPGSKKNADGVILEEEIIEEEQYVEDLQNEMADESELAIETPQKELTEEEQHCFVCNAFSGSYDTCSKHLEMTHSGLLPYRCDQCLLMVADVHDLNEHLRNHGFGCLYCAHIFELRTDLDKHRSTCIGYSCVGCGKSFMFVSELKEHLGCTSSKVQREQYVDLVISTFRGSAVPLRCAICDEKFTRNASLARHLEREHATTSVVLHCCDVCPQKFTTLAVARHHRLSHENGQTMKNSKANECLICLENFKFNRELLLHLETAHPDVTVELYQCQKCDRKFTNEAKLQKHDYNMHQGRQQSFFCSFCGRVFNKRIELRDHENIHRGVKEHRCYECNRDFSYKSSYDRHMQVVHNDSKQFTCQYCQKSFKRKPTLKVHLRLHTGEKPYQCEFCSRRFVDPSSFHKHGQREHPRKT